MDINRIIQNLKADRDVLAAAIECLERLAAGRAGKHGAKAYGTIKAHETL